MSRHCPKAKVTGLFIINETVDDQISANARPVVLEEIGKFLGIRPYIQHTNSITKILSESQRPKNCMILLLNEAPTFSLMYRIQQTIKYNTISFSIE